jgi:hypothetical protein
VPVSTVASSIAFVDFDVVRDGRDFWEGVSPSTMILVDGEDVELRDGQLLVKVDRLPFALDLDPGWQSGSAFALLSRLRDVVNSGVEEQSSIGIVVKSIQGASGPQREGSHRSMSPAIKGHTRSGRSVLAVTEVTATSNGSIVTGYEVAFM